MIKIIAAMSRNRVIGNKGKIPWHLPPDLNFFKEMTKDNIVIMGRRTWESLPVKPLPSRTNIVISRTAILTAENTVVHRDFYYAIHALKNYSLELKQDIYIIGGGALYRQSLAMNIVDEILLTEIDAEFPGDTLFPEIPKGFKSELILEAKYKDLSFKINRWSNENKREDS
jgi:dihydrofolate reductase